MNPQHVFTLLPSDTASSKDGQMAADDMIIMGLQASTQWDGLAHVGYKGFFYNGVPQGMVNNFMGATKNDIAKVAAEAHLPRGAARHRRPQGGRGTARLLRDHRGRRARGRGAPGGAGRVRRHPLHPHRLVQVLRRRRPAALRRQHGRPGQDICRWIHDREIAALALDQANGECWPTPIPGATIPFHQVAIRDIGLTLGEMFNFTDLAADCEQDGVWEFFFSATGLKVTGAVGTPLTPVAIK